MAVVSHYISLLSLWVQEQKARHRWPVNSDQPNPQMVLFSISNRKGAQDGNGKRKKNKAKGDRNGSETKTENE